MSNSILQAAEQKVESQLTPPNQADYMRIVVAGMNVLLDKGPNGILAALKQSKNPISDCAIGAINLCLLMRKQSRWTMPLRAMVPAAMTLMLQALDFADKSGIVKVGNPELVQATHIFTNQMFARLGISQQMIHTALSKVHGMTQDPGQMELINRAAGVVKDPRASTPTPLTGGDNVPA